jgi:hypothetical protein
MIAETLQNSNGNSVMDPVRVQGQNDVLRMIDILQISSDHDLQARTRVGVLSQYS